MDDRIDSHELVFAIEGERLPRQIRLPKTATARDVIAAVVAETERVELTEIFLEDDEECLVEEHRVRRALTEKPQRDAQVVLTSGPVEGYALARAFLQCGAERGDGIVEVGGIRLALPEQRHNSRNTARS